MKRSSMPSNYIPPYHNLTIQKELKEGSDLNRDHRYHKEASTNHHVVVEKKEVAATNSTKAELEKKPSMDDINESAEAFINKFRKQLLIQRLESIENYEQMLARGL